MHILNFRSILTIVALLCAHQANAVGCLTAYESCMEPYQCGSTCNWSTLNDRYACNAAVAKKSCDAAACPSVTIQPEIQSIYDSQMTEACSGNIPDKPTPIAQQTGPAFTGGSEASPAAGSGGSAATETGAAAGASSTAGSGAEGALVGKGVVLGAVGVVGVVGLVV